MHRDTTPKIGLALGGGGARGLAHLGVMQYLDEIGLPIHCIAGTSMGAITGAAIAAGKWRDLAEGYARLDWIKLLPMVDFTLSGSGLLDGRKALAFLREHIPVTRIEQLGCAYAAVAADLRNREKVAFTSGDLFMAMRSSFAIPGIFTPVMHQGRLLVDGGIVELLPVLSARDLGATDIIAVEVSGVLTRPYEHHQDDQPLIARLHDQLKNIEPLAQSEWGRQILNWFERAISSEQQQPPGLFEIMREANDFMQGEMTRMQMAAYPPRWLVTPDLHEFSIWDYHRAEEIIQRGYEAAQRQISPDTLNHIHI